MPDDKVVTTGEFGSVFVDFLQRAVAESPSPERSFQDRLTAHLGVSPKTLSIVKERFAIHEHANVQVAVQAYLDAPGRSFEVHGVTWDRSQGDPALADLVYSSPATLVRAAPGVGSVSYTNVVVGDGKRVACVELGLFLVRDGDTPFVLLLWANTSEYHAAVTLEVMAVDRSGAEQLLAELRALISRCNVYRGQVISLSQRVLGPLEVTFHQLKPVDRDDIVLPEDVLERIERQTIRFTKLNPRLRAAGCHLKGGLLLWGPPGTGKTLTAMYLARQMPERTVLVLKGQTMKLIETSCTMARDLQPSTVILEDVDLVAQDRTSQGPGANSVLFELLNQMDGLGDDADVLFVLTTNRPQLLERALAARPGRIDQTIEVPLPDADCRGRLLDLYTRGVDLRLKERDRIVEKTKGASAAFIKELIRKATVLAAEEDPAAEVIAVDDVHVVRALLEMTVERGVLSKTLSGVEPGVGRRPPC